MWIDRYLGSYAGKTVLVTGGAGAIGSNLSRVLSQLGTREVVIVDDLSSSYEWNVPRANNITFVKGDILDDHVLKDVFKSKPEYVFHLAAHFANQNSVERPEKDLMINGMGILKVLNNCVYPELSRFVYSSSGCGVYGLDSKMPFDESDVSLKLFTPYQVTKLLGELYSNYFHNLYKVPTVNARFFNSYGPGEVPGKYRNVIPNFFYWSMQGKSLPITGTGEETRDFTNVLDIINGLLALGIEEEAIGEAVNLGTSVETRIIHLANSVNRITGSSAGYFLSKPREWDKKKRLRASIEKARRVIGYEPGMDFTKGLAMTGSWFRDNWKEIKSSAEF